MSDETVLQEVVDNCLNLFRSKAKVTNGASLESIQRVEDSLDLSLPFVLKEILKVTDGVTDLSGKSLMWSTSQMLSQNQYLRTDFSVRQKYMPLNDFLFFSEPTSNGYLGFPMTSDGLSAVFHWKPVNDSRECVSYHLSTFFERFFDQTSRDYRDWFDRLSDPGGWDMSTPGLQVLKSKIEKYWQTFSPVSETEIQAVEQHLGMRLPDDLREIYLYSNGIDSEYGIAVYKLQDIVSENAEIKAEQLQLDWVLPVDSFLFFAPEGNGDYFGFPITEAGIGKTVMELDHEDDSRIYAAPDIFNLLDYQLEDYDEE